MTEAGTARLALLLARAITVLLEAVPESVAVQVEEAPGPSVAGLQLNAVSVAGGGEVTVTVPPLATNGMDIPTLEAAMGMVTWMARVVLEELPSVAVTDATMPFPIALAFVPQIMQTTCPAETVLQAAVLPAPIATAPALTLTALKSVELKANVN